MDTNALPSGSCSTKTDSSSKPVRMRRNYLNFIDEDTLLPTATKIAQRFPISQGSREDQNDKQQALVVIRFSSGLVSAARVVSILTEIRSKLFSLDTSINCLIPFIYIQTAIEAFPIKSTTSTFEEFITPVDLDKLSTHNLGHIVLVGETALGTDPQLVANAIGMLKGKLRTRRKSENKSDMIVIPQYDDILQLDCDDAIAECERLKTFAKCIKNQSAATHMANQLHVSRMEEKEDVSDSVANKALNDSNYWHTEARKEKRKLADGAHDRDPQVGRWGERLCNHLFYRLLLRSAIASAYGTRRVQFTCTGFAREGNETMEEFAQRMSLAQLMTNKKLEQVKVTNPTGSRPTLADKKAATERREAAYNAERCRKKRRSE